MWGGVGCVGVCGDVWGGVCGVIGGRMEDGDGSGWRMWDVGVGCGCAVARCRGLGGRRPGCRSAVGD